MRSSIRFLPLISAFLLFAGASVAISACSSTNTVDNAAGADAGSDSAKPTVDEATPDDSGSPQTHDECIAACNTQHPNSKPKEDAIDKCWNDNCSDQCFDGKPFDGGAATDAGDAGVAADAGDPLCGTGVKSGETPDCDKCTEAFCCTSWTGCFDDQDCSDLDDCYGKCPQN